jgi:CubicO group peptidase (beta-lactamase class C family)
MLLVEDGFLGLNRPVQEYIPEFTGEGKERVMVHQLFTHTSGITDAYVEAALEKDDDGSMGDKQFDRNLHPHVHRVLQLAYDTPLTHPPGDVMEYSSVGIYLIAEIIRRLCGKSLNSFATERICTPLGMKDTSYGLPEAKRDRYCFRPDDAPRPYYNDPDFLQRPSPSGGGFSTVMDMAIFGQMFLNKGHYGDVRIFSPVTVEAMTRDQIPGTRAVYFDEEFPEAGWSLVWSVNEVFKGEVYGEQLLSPSSFGHGGAGGVVLGMDPDRDLLLVFFSVVMYELEERPLLGADLFMNMVASAIVDS